MDQRIAELVALAEVEGLQLPYPPQTIAQVEEAGGVVDLATGAVLWNADEWPCGLESTVFGELYAEEDAPPLDPDPWVVAVTYNAGWDCFFAGYPVGIVIRHNDAMAGWKAAKAEARQADVDYQ